MSKESQPKIGTWPTPERTVRIVMPAVVANDLGRLQKSLASLAERLGCTHCVSGVNCIFMNERDFIINPAGDAIESLKGVIIVDG